eukprot:6717701-Prymnesium_polylepis.1
MVSAPLACTASSALATQRSLAAVALATKIGTIASPPRRRLHRQLIEQIERIATPPPRLCFGPVLKACARQQCRMCMHRPCAGWNVEMGWLCLLERGRARGEPVRRRGLE